MKNKMKIKLGRLFFELLAIIISPMILLGAYSIYSSISLSQDSAFNVELNSLKSGTLLIEERIDRLAPEGEYKYENNVLYKGDYILDNNFIDTLGFETDLQCSIFIGKVRALTTIEDENGNRLINKEIDPEVYRKIINGETVNVTKLDINGEDYIVSYTPLYYDNEIIGSIFVGKTRSDVLNYIYDNIMTNIIIIAIGVSVLLIFSAIILRKIVIVIMDNIYTLNGISEKNLTVKVNEKYLDRKDEIGDISRACEKLLKSQKKEISTIIEIAKNINDSSEELYAASNTVYDNLDNIDKSIEEVAGSATSQANDTQKATEASLEIGELVERTKNLTEELYISTEDMIKENNDIVTKFEELTDINDNTNKVVVEIGDVINSTNDSVNEIAKVLEMINDISSQINLLSLNASIESARAGEHGKGFAVIASEIRDLSDKTKENTVNIESLIKSLIEKSSKSVKSIDDVKKVIELQNESLKSTQNSINKNNIILNQTKDKVNDITEFASELTKAKDTIIDILGNLAAISEENAAASEQTSSFTTESMSYIKELSNCITNIVNLASEMNIQIEDYKL